MLQHLLDSQSRGSFCTSDGRSHLASFSQVCPEVPEAVSSAAEPRSIHFQRSAQDLSYKGKVLVGHLRVPVVLEGSVLQQVGHGWIAPCSHCLLHVVEQAQ